MKVSVKKILGVAAFALAATFFAGTFASCDTGTNPSSSNEDDELADDPASEVKWEFADEGTVTRIAVELDESILSNKDGVAGPAITTWENIKFYGWAEKAGLDATKPLGEWGGTKAQLIEAEGKKTIAYVNIPAAKTPKTEAINIIVNGSSGDEDVQLAIGSIKAGECKIYKITGEGEEAAAALVDWAEEEQEGTVAEGEEPEPEVVKGTIKIGITADYYAIADWEKIAVYVHGDKEVLGGWPGTEAVLDTTLGIYTVETEVEGENWSVIFNNNNNGSQFDAGKIKKDAVKLYTHAGTWIDWDGESADTTEPAEPPAPPAPTGADSTIIAVDISKISGMSGWTSVVAYVYGGTIGNGGWGAWPGLQFDRSKTDSNIFFADVTGKEGTGTFIFNNGSAQLGDVNNVSIEEGKKYIYDGSAVVEWEDFSLDYIYANPITAESTLIAIDVSTDLQTNTDGTPKAKGWTNADVADTDTSENNIFGGKKVILTKSTSNANIWYADISGKEGTAKLVFSNTKSATREANEAVTIEAGKKYIYKAGDVVEWTDFSLAVINAEDKAAEETEPAVTPDTGDDGDTTPAAGDDNTGDDGDTTPAAGDDTTGENPDEGVPPEELNPPEDDETDPTTVPGDGE